jgi:hypothetical protein
LFTFTCVWCIVSAFFGYRTLRDYDKDSVKAEKYLLIEYSLITLGAYGAGFVEFTGIGAKVKYRLAEGVWKHYGDTPDPKFGHSVYDILPEKVGMTIFFAWMAIVWFLWPIKLPKVDTRV